MCHRALRCTHDWRDGVSPQQDWDCLRAPETSPNSRIPHQGPGVLGELLGDTQVAFVSVSSFVSMVSEAW